MAFDTQAATEAGHSIDDQISHLAKLHNYDSKAAEEAGFSKEAQLEYLAALDMPAQAAGPSLIEKAADYVGIGDEMLAPAIGTTIGAVTGPAIGPAIGATVDALVNKAAGKVAPPGTTKPAGVPQGVINWYEQESGNPYAGGKTKEAAYEKGQRAAGEPLQSRGSKIKIRKGNLGINNQIEKPEPTLAQKTAANIVNAERVNSPSFTRRMLGTSVLGGEIGNAIEEAKQGNYGRAALSGLGALGAAGSQSSIKPVRAIGTGLSAIVPAIQMMLPESEDKSNINKKTGGSIKGYSKGKLVEEGGAKIMDILKNKMAPLYAKAEGVPPPLPRATPKTDAELMAFAERMAPQVRGDFVRAPGQTTSVAGKTRAQFDREKDLQHDIRDVFPLKQVSNYSDANNQGKVKIGIAGDQTLTGKDVYSIAGNPLTEPSRQYGGALYPAAHPQGWASEKGAAQAIQNLADEVAEQYGGVDVLGQYLKMGPEASNYAMHNADAIIKSINPNQIKQLDTLNEMIRKQFPDFAGIENQAAILEQSRKNPDLRKYLDYLVNTKKHAETFGLPSGADMRHALSEPDLRNLEIGATGKSIMQMKPGAKITPSSELTTTTYSHDIPGDYVGGTKYARPHELEFSDSYAALQNKIATVQDMAKQVVAENPKLDPQAALAYGKKYGQQGFGGFRMAQPRQIMDQQYMDETGKYEDYMKQLLGFNEGGTVQHFDNGGSPKAKALSSGLEALRNMIKAQDRTPVVPVPNRWFAQPEKFPHVQGMVNKTLDASQLPREAFHSGAFIDPRTGQILDRNIYNDVGVLIDPETGRPMMSAGKQSAIDILDPKTGSYTKSNLVRQSLFKPTGGDPMLADLPFIATIEKGGMGHKYGLGTEYATPTELYNTMTGANPTLRPRSRGDVFGMGDVIGQVQIGGRGIPHDVYEKLFVAPKGSDVPGVKLSKAEGGAINGYAPGGKVGVLEMLAKKLMPLAEREANKAKFLEDSKIPQRLYHATTASEKDGTQALSQLKQSKEGSLGAGIYMTPKTDFANTYAEGAGGYVMPLYANLYNPLILKSTMGPGGNGDPMMLALTQLGLTPEKAEKIIEKAYDTRGYIGKEVMTRAQKQGYDGIAQYKDGDLSEVVSFSPYGIKSAIGNSGEYAPWSPELSKKQGGSI
jgi:hypothetical protein